VHVGELKEVIDVELTFLCQSYDKLQFDTVLRHTKFLTAFAIEASYLSG